MCIFHLLLIRLQHVLRDPISHRAIRPTALAEFEDLATSGMVVYLTFEKRMHDLMRGWRSQGHDIDLQLGRFADGLFQDIQREVCYSLWLYF